jgi:hypothetical protein
VCTHWLTRWMNAAGWGWRRCSCFFTFSCCCEAEETASCTLVYRNVRQSVITLRTQAPCLTSSLTVSLLLKRMKAERRDVFIASSSVQAWLYHSCTGRAGRQAVNTISQLPFSAVRKRNLGQLTIARLNSELCRTHCTPVAAHRLRCWSVAWMLNG